MPTESKFQALQEGHTVRRSPAKREAAGGVFSPHFLSGPSPGVAYLANSVQLIVFVGQARDANWVKQYNSL